MQPTGQDEAERSRSPFEAFRREVMADAPLRAELASLLDADAFVALAVSRAGERGIGLDAEEVARRVWAPGAPDRPQAVEIAPGWPPAGWLPSSVSHATAAGGDAPVVDWTHFAGEPLSEPFYEDSLRKARARPFNRVFRVRTALASLAAGAPVDAPRPSGLIFHLSRAGSTLAAQMLAAVPAHVVVSEAPPIDDVLRLEAATAGDPAGLLQAMVAALARGGAAGQRLFLKLESWHVLAGAVFRRAFADTPWVFIYRDPLEVLVSQMQRRGSHTVRGLLAAAIYGIAPEVPDDAYCALVLRRTCEAALAMFAGGGGLLVDYTELPQAMATRILPHFGVAPGDAERALMTRVAGRDAKAPWQRFAPDADAKRLAATPRLRRLVEQHLEEPYRALEALRRQG